MAKLDALKVNSAPAAFAELAAKHNALVGLVANIKGAGGIDFHIPDLKPGEGAPVLSVPRKLPGTLPKLDYSGKIIVMLNPTAAAAATTGGGAGGGLTYTLQVCIGGVTKNIDFYIARGPY